MGGFQLLDCTLRDGGYLNDWEFGHDAMVNIFNRLISAGVDVVEVGFLDGRRSFDVNRSIMPDTGSVRKIYGELDKGGSLIVGMIDYGTCGIERLEPASESYLDGIRVIFKKEIMYPAIAFCRQVKALGYKVFTQAVSITSYSDEELLELVSLVNDFKPYAMSMVDTYGLLHQENLTHVFEILNANLDPDIILGYHGHNNFQMGYANCIEMLSQKADRTLLVDATLYGMGKSAGNTPIELIAMHMNECLGKHYDINQMLESIEIDIMEIYKKVQWGYNLFYYVAALNKCHPNYVSFLMNKHTLSIKSINEVLRSLEGKKRLLYDKEYIEQLYLAYQTNECNDAGTMLRLKEALGGHKVLLIGPGKRILEDADRVRAYVDERHPLVIAINYIPNCCRPDYIFLTNSKRYVPLEALLSRPENRSIPVIATSNVTKTHGTFPYELNYSSLIDPKADITDNSLIMLLKILMASGVRRVALAGFDGYSVDEINYFATNMEYSFVKEKASSLNAYARAFFAEHREALEVEFVTPSRYQEIA